jgi:hypothetical protein
MEHPVEGPANDFSNPDNDDATRELLHWSRTGTELREAVTYLIRHREALRDNELQRLTTETRTLLSRLSELRQEALLEEIRCFKDVLLLHRKALTEHERQSD